MENLTRNNNSTNSPNDFSQAHLHAAYLQQQQAVAAHQISLQRQEPVNGFWRPPNLEQFKQEIFKLPNQDPFQTFNMDLNQLHPTKYPVVQRLNHRVINTNKFLQSPSIPPQPGSFMESLAEAVNIENDLTDTQPSKKSGTSATARPSYSMQKNLPVPPQASVIKNAKLIPKKNYKACHAPGCTKYAQRQGLCRMHEKIKNGETLQSRSVNQSGRLYRMCCYPDCNKHSQKYHVCRTHEKELAEESHEESIRNRSDYREVFKSKLAKLKVCRHPFGCKNIIRAKGRCTEHLPRPQYIKNNDQYYSPLSTKFQNQMVNYDHDQNIPTKMNKILLTKTSNYQNDEQDPKLVNNDIAGQSLSNFNSIKEDESNKNNEDDVLEKKSMQENTTDLDDSKKKDIKEQNNDDVEKKSFEISVNDSKINETEEVKSLINSSNVNSIKEDKTLNNDPKILII